MSFLAILLALLQVGDVVTTERILKNGKELNPIMVWLFVKFGMHNVLVIKAFVVTCIGVWLAVTLPIVLIPLCVLYVGVVGWNSYQIYKTKV